MKKPFQFPVSVLVLLGWVSWVGCFEAAAQTPSGTRHYGPFAARLWDISGRYELKANGPISGKNRQFSFPITLAHSAAGKVTGAGTLDAFLDGEKMTGTYSVSGTVATSGTQVRCNFSIALKLSGTVLGSKRSATLSLSEALVIDPATRTMAGTSTGKGSLSGLGTASINEKVSLALPEGAGGSWVLETTILPSVSTKIAGSSRLTRANGKSSVLANSGSYASKTGKSTFNAVGTGVDAGISFSVVTVGATMDLGSLNGVAFGQTLAFKDDAVLNRPPPSTPGGSGGTGVGSLSCTMLSRCSSFEIGVVGTTLGGNRTIRITKQNSLGQVLEAQITGTGYTRTVKWEYDVVGRTKRESGTLTAGGKSLAYDATISWNSFGQISSVQVTGSGNLISPSKQSATFGCR